MTSKEGNFVLRFFEHQNSSNYYIGILYNKISVPTIVWVANREISVTDPTTSELKIADDGNLVLFNQFKAVIWFTNASIPSNSTVVVILDTGNLQLRDATNSSIVFWESFDHPTDAWLPGAKLGHNNVTNQRQGLLAWRSKVDPAPGIFSFETDPKGTNQFFLLSNTSYLYWKCGVWNGHFFQLIPEMFASYTFKFQLITTQVGSYFTYIVENSNFTTRAVIDYDSGQLQQLLWVEDKKFWMLIWTQPRSKCCG